MLYQTTSSILRALSYSKGTRTLYRHLGNIKNSTVEKRKPIKKKYPINARILFNTMKKFNIGNNNMSVLEMGTGWVHWDALIIRNIMKCNISIYDVWDNRSFNLFMNYCRQLSDPNIRDYLEIQHIIDEELMKKVIICEDMDSVYETLNFKYFIDKSGLLSCFTRDEFDFIRSNAVFEHLKRDDISTILRRSFEITKPGGWAIHLVSLADHLSFYARSAHRKEFLRFSRDEYDSRFQNDLQYVNLLQVPEWIKLIEEAGFDIIATERLASTRIDNINIDEYWRHMSDEDLSCVVVQFILRKPYFSG
jgi:hypothetical protein